MLATKGFPYFAIHVKGYGIAAEQRSVLRRTLRTTNQ